MRPRHQFVADDRFSPLIASLEERLLRAVELVGPDNLCALWGNRAEELLRNTAVQVGANALGVWLRDQDGKHLVLAYNTDPSGKTLRREVRQPVTEGIVSLVLHSEQPFLENDVQKNAQHSKLVDVALHQQTQAMIVVPFYLQNQCRGVLSCVQVRRENGADGKNCGFDMHHLAAMQLAASLLSDVIDYQLLRATIGWT
jgi:putative methionine-R-sulfoxide reductase with GAF domain